MKKFLEYLGLKAGSLMFSKKLMALILTLIGIICTIFITDDEGTRSIIKMLIEMLESVEGGSGTQLLEP